MTFDTLFMLELLLVAVLVAVVVGSALYFVVNNRRRTSRETGREAGTADTPAGTEPVEPASSASRRAPHGARREFYKSMGLETAEDMKLRLYSIEEYRDELGGAYARPDGDFVAALKAYRQLDDGWHDYSPRKAAEVLELAPEDYEVDAECGVLLLRRLPPGLPVSARDVL